MCLPIDTFAALGGNALTDAEIDVQRQAGADGGLPNTFVPGRNLIFLTFAAAYAYQRSIRHLVTGVAQTDYSGYPDCRETTISALQEALNLTKAETVNLAVEVGALEAMAETHTCYNGQRPPCGHCPACQLRARGFDEAGVADPLLSAE